jgi:hypothetical protein
VRHSQQLLRFLLQLLDGALALIAAKERSSLNVKSAGGVQYTHVAVGKRRVAFVAHCCGQPEPGAGPGPRGEPPATIATALPGGAGCVQVWMPEVFAATSTSEFCVVLQKIPQMAV